MNTEELEQNIEERENRNTASLNGNIAGYQKGSFETLFPVHKDYTNSASLVTPTMTSQNFTGNLENFLDFFCEPLWKERTAGSLSIDKIGDE